MLSRDGRYNVIICLLTPLIACMVHYEAVVDIALYHHLVAVLSDHCHRVDADGFAYRAYVPQVMACYAILGKYTAVCWPYFAVKKAFMRIRNM